MLYKLKILQFIPALGCIKKIGLPINIKINKDIDKYKGNKIINNIRAKEVSKNIFILCNLISLLLFLYQYHIWDKN